MNISLPDTLKEFVYRTAIPNWPVLSAHQIVDGIDRHADAGGNQQNVSGQTH